MNSDSKKKSPPSQPVRWRVRFSDAVQQHIKWLLLMLVVVVYAVLLFPGLVVDQHHYQIGDIAERDIKAPYDFFVEDHAATDASLQLSLEQVLTVYDFDPRVAPQLMDKVRAAFKKMHQIMDGVRAREETAQKPAEEVLAPDIIPSSESAPPAEIERALWEHKSEFSHLLGVDVSHGAFQLLINEKFSLSIADIIVRVIADIMSNGVVANKEQLLKEAEKGIQLRNVGSQTEKTVLALRQYYGPDQAKTMVRVVAEPLVKELDYGLVNLVAELSQSLIQPNITLNRNETEERKKRAIASIKPVMYKIKAGEMVLREGERVSAAQLVKLRELARQTGARQVPLAGLGAMILLAMLVVTIYRLYFLQQRYARLNTTKNMVLLTCMLLIISAMVKLSAAIGAVLANVAPLAMPPEAIAYAVPTAAGPMLVCLLLGLNIALPFSLLAAVCASMLLGSHLEMFIFFVIGNSAAAYWVQNCRERRVIITAGIKLGLLNIILALATGLSATDSQTIGLVWNISLSFLGGIFCSVVTVGLAPLVEMGFGYTTDISLLELANLDRPILRQLMIEAPGTYHHCVVVGSMVEAAAAEIGANPLLAKVSGYYHDIGKVKKPLYFIENQAGGPNKHDKLAPSMSSLILIAHVKDGVEIAQKNKLGQAIIDAIQQHHGTSLIHYFYEKAKHQKGDGLVPTDDYRYPGPKPQTKEVGLVMLAEVVEAASRTLENPTPARIQGLVQHLINKVFSDGQLDNCELTLRDLNSIAKSFNKILNGIHHHRIEYVESTPKENGKGKHDGIDRQPAEKSSARDPKSARESSGHLKRLGMS